MIFGLMNDIILYWRQLLIESTQPVHRWFLSIIDKLLGAIFVLISRLLPKRFVKFSLKKTSVWPLREGRQVNLVLGVEMEAQIRSGKVK